MHRREIEGRARPADSTDNFISLSLAGIYFAIYHEQLSLSAACNRAMIDDTPRRETPGESLFAIIERNAAQSRVTCIAHDIFSRSHALLM